MDEVAFVESLFAPEMRSAASLLPSPPPSCGRAKGNSLVPPPPNSLLGGGISFAQLQTPFQPPADHDAPLFVRLHEDEMFSQMLNDQDFPDLHSFKKEKTGLLEPLDLPRNPEPAFCGLGEQLQQPPRHGYTLPEANLIPVFPLGNAYGGNFNFPLSPATQLWLPDDVSTPGSSNFQRVHSMKHAMNLSMSAMLQQPSPGSVDMFHPMATSSQHPTPLWVPTSQSEEHKRPAMKLLDTLKAEERPPFSLTISPPASLIKELIVSADFGALDGRVKRPREENGPAQPKAKAARRTAPVSQENNSSRANGKVSKGKKCIEAGCTRRAQSNSRCKAHGGGARCQFNGPGGCTRSSQGGGFCRAHGGGKRCEFPGCTRGQQRKGRCYVHGGIRKCQHGSCEKKDRGNGFCISHGGGKRCEFGGCSRAVRRGMLCQLHETHDGETGESVTL